MTTFDRRYHDKEITIYEKQTIQESDGWTAETASPTDETFMACVWFDNFAQLKEDHGISEEIDIVLSTFADIAMGQIIAYNEKTYRIHTVIPYNSYNLLAGEEWSSKSSESMS